MYRQNNSVAGISIKIVSTGADKRNMTGFVLIKCTQRFTIQIILSMFKKLCSQSFKKRNSTQISVDKQSAADCTKGLQFKKTTVS